MSATAKRIEMVRLLQALRQGDEPPGETVLRALRAALAMQSTAHSAVSEGIEAMYYMHKIDPHCAAEFADLYFEGHRYALTKSKAPPVSAVQCIMFFGSDDDRDKILSDNVGKITDCTAVSAGEQTGS